MASVHQTSIGPDALAAEYEGREVELHVPLVDREDGLRGFEVRDPDGYVLFFGRPTARTERPSPAPG